MYPRVNIHTTSFRRRKSHLKSLQIKDSLYLTTELQRVHNRCMDIIGQPRSTFLPLSERRDDHTVREYTNIVRSDNHPCKRFLEAPRTHVHNLRKTNEIRAPLSRTNRHQSSFIARGAGLYNKL
jgi:hypothetical protein